nr:hypothetical protein [Micromonospora sp. DSM 115978]
MAAGIVDGKWSLAQVPNDMAAGATEGASEFAAGRAGRGARGLTHGPDVDLAGGRGALPTGGGPDTDATAAPAGPVDADTRRLPEDSEDGGGTPVTVPTGPGGGPDQNGLPDGPLGRGDGAPGAGGTPDADGGGRADPPPPGGGGTAAGALVAGPVRDGGVPPVRLDDAA